MKGYLLNLQIGQRKSKAGSHLYIEHAGYATLGSWFRLEKERTSQWTLQQASTVALPALLFFLGSSFPSSCSSDFCRCESERARGAYRESM